MSHYKATIIISIYNNIDALRIILNALKTQSVTDFEIIVSEDGQSATVEQFIAGMLAENPALTHLTQDDIGFRKNMALNRAIIAAQSNYLIFIDGDCVPHRRFIESHVANAQADYLCSGRRSELGPRMSKFIIEHPRLYQLIYNRLVYTLLALPAQLDGAKNYEAGYYSKLFHQFSKNKQTGILGCNFSCYKHDLLRVNGFNEDYISPTTGEDTDIEWRMRQLGMQVKNIKFLAPVYHLHHSHKFQLTEANKALMDETIRTHKVVCEHGIAQRINTQTNAT